MALTWTSNNTFALAVILNACGIVRKILQIDISINVTLTEQNGLGPCSSFNYRLWVESMKIYNT